MAKDRIRRVAVLFSHHAEPIAVRVRKHDVVGSIRIAPDHVLCAKSDQPFDFSRLIASIEVEGGADDPPPAKIPW